ncbi:MAG: BrnT family toxin [Stellaceae bacterium]
MAMPPFDWNLKKEEQNIQKHGVDFATASQIWAGSVFERVDNRRNYGEVRFLAFGEVEGRVLAVVYTWREATRRIISARKANPRERALFSEEAGRRGGAP